MKSPPGPLSSWWETTAHAPIVVFSGKPDIEEIGRQLTERNLTLDEFAQDNFGTLLAIRLPGGEQRDISYGLALNHVNLFRHVFAYLNDDPDILKTREEPSLSRVGDLILGRDNTPVLELER